MTKPPSPRRQRAEPPPKSDPEARVAELTFELDALRLQAIDDRFQIESLREERDELYSRNKRLERFVQSLQVACLNQLAPPRVLTEYSPGILHAVEAPWEGAAPASGKDAARFAIDLLPAPAPQLLKTLAEEPLRSAELDVLAARLGINRDGGHFKRGLSTLRKHGLVEQVATRVSVVGTFRMSSTPYAAAAGA